MYRDLEVKKKEVQTLKEEIANKNALIATQGEIIRVNNKERSEAKVEKQSLLFQKDGLELEKDKLNKEVEELRETVERQAKQIIDYERIKKVLESTRDNEDEFLKSLREKGSIQEQAKTFYEFLRLKKIDLKKAKEKIQNLTIELAKYKEKANSHESFVQKKQQPTTNYSRESSKMEILEDGRSFGYEEKTIFDKIKKLKSQEPVPLLKATSSIFGKENIKSDDAEFKLLEEGILKSSLESSEKTKQVESIQIENSSRVIKNLILPKGVNKAPQGVSKPINAFLSQKSSQQDNNTSKDINSFNLKKVKLNSEEFSLKSNIQQKLSLLKGPNH